MVKYKYIIMCGGNYDDWEKPRQLSIINGEELVARTIRLLRENNIEDISISSDNPIFEKFNVPILKHNNSYDVENHKIVNGGWYNAFYPTDVPTCYIFGDVVFSPEAIKKIVETETEDIEFFGSKKPFAYNYIKEHEEPFALKVVNTKHLKEAIEKTRELDKQGKFWRKPIMWELWTVIKNTPLQVKRDQYTADYIAINDYTCDVDRKEDIIKFNLLLGGKNMIKLEATINFTLEAFDKIKIISRKKEDKNENGHVYVGDIFECDQEIAKYVTGENYKKAIVAKILEVIPEEKKEEIHEEITKEPETAVKSVKKSKKNKKNTG